MADEATALLNQWRIDGQDAQAARLAPPKEEEGTMARIAREVSEGQAAQEKTTQTAKEPTSIDWSATAALPPRLKGVAIQRHSLTETDKSLPWAEFSTPDGPVKVAQGSMFPGTNYELTYLSRDPSGQLQAEFTSGTGENFVIGGERGGAGRSNYSDTRFDVLHQALDRLGTATTSSITPEALDNLRQELEVLKDRQDARIASEKKRTEALAWFKTKGLWNDFYD